MICTYRIIYIYIKTEVVTCSLLLGLTKGFRKWFGQGLLFRQITSSKIAHACAKLLRHYHVQWSKWMEKSGKMERDYHGQRWTTWFLWNEGDKLSDIHCRLSAVCGEKAPTRNTVQPLAVTVARKLHRGAVREWFRNNSEEWFHEDIRKLHGRQ